MRNPVSELTDILQTGRFKLKMDLALRRPSYKTLLEMRMHRYTRPADTECIRTAGHRLAMRQRLHSYTG